MKIFLVQLLVAFSFLSIVLETPKLWAEGGMMAGAGAGMVAGMGAGLVQSVSDEKWAQYAGAGLNTYAGYAYWTKGASTCPLAGGCNYVLMGMGVMSWGQAAMTVDAALNTEKTAADINGNQFNMDQFPDISQVEGGDFSTIGNGMGNSTPSDFRDGLNQRIDDAASKYGVKLSEDGKSINIPGKGKIPLSAFGSKEGLLAAGFSEAELAGYDAMKSKMNADLKNKVAKFGLNKGPGGKGGTGGSGGPKTIVKVEDANSDPFANLLKASKKKKKRGPASVSGMQKLFNGTLIGVKEDNIFEMIHRRYRKKHDQGFFISPHTRLK